jgi:hypothetical protein
MVCPRSMTRQPYSQILAKPGRNVRDERSILVLIIVSGITKAPKYIKIELENTLAYHTNVPLTVLYNKLQNH